MLCEDYFESSTKMSGWGTGMAAPWKAHPQLFLCIEVTFRSKDDPMNTNMKWSSYIVSWFFFFLNSSKMYCWVKADSFILGMKMIWPSFTVHSTQETHFLLGSFLLQVQISFVWRVDLHRYGQCAMLTVGNSVGRSSSKYYCSLESLKAQWSETAHLGSMAVWQPLSFKFRAPKSLTCFTKPSIEMNSISLPRHFTDH